MLIPEFDVYLSYAPEDRERVASLVQELEQTGLKVWWQHHHLKPDEAIATLKRQLNKSRVHLVVWSRNSAGSGRVQAEARIGSALGRLLATRIEPIIPPRDTSAVGYADLSDWRGGKEHLGIRQAFATIWKLIGKGIEIAEPPPVPRIVRPESSPENPSPSQAAPPTSAPKPPETQASAEPEVSPPQEDPEKKTNWNRIITWGLVSVVIFFLLLYLIMFFISAS